MKVSKGPRELFFDGMEALKRGSLSTAEEHLLNALELSPGRPSILINLSIVYSKKRRYADALEFARAAVNADSSDPYAWIQLGAAQLQQRQFEDALQSLEAGIEQDGTIAAAFSNRGSALLELGRLDDALASLEKAIDLKPDYFEAHLNRGRVLHSLSRVEQAILSYKAAADLRPDSASAWSTLAQLQSEFGQFEEADMAYRKAHLLDPRAVDPLCGAAAIVKFRAGDPLIGEIKLRLEDKTLSDLDRARLHHAYAKICNDLERFDEAMESLSQGKRLLGPIFDTRQQEADYTALKRLFTRQFFLDRRGFGVSDERPVFIVGMPRSGTTLVERALASHRSVRGMGELLQIPKIVHSFRKQVHHPEGFFDALSRLTAHDVAEMAETYREAYRKIDERYTRLVDKMPQNFEQLGLIALLFPKAHVIHCRRNPLDTCISVYMQSYINKHTYAQDLGTLGRYHRNYADLMEHWHQVLPLPIHNCDYEEMIGDFEGSLRSMLAFLGLEWDPNCLEFHRQDGQVRTASNWQVRQPVFSTSVNRWRHYRKHIGPLVAALGSPEMTEGAES